MAKKIERLTKKQSALMPVVRDEWIKIGLSTEPADRPRAETALIAMYDHVGLKAPRIVWVGSPMAAAVARADLVSKLTKGGLSAAERKKMIADATKDCVYGQHDANWLAFYDFFGRIGLEENVRPLGPLMDFAKSANWALPHEKICWISDRPEIVRQDAQNRIHCTDGPAIKYRDGWSIWAVNGARVPELVIMRPSEITVAMIEAEPNAEVRRVMIDRFGGGKDAGGGPGAYAKASGAVILDHQEGVGTLLRKEVPGDEPIVTVEVVNSTPEPDGSWKRYHLRVDPQIRPMFPDGTFGEPQKPTALNAVASTFGKTGEEYRPSVES